MRFSNWQICECVAAAALVFPVVAGLAGCGNGIKSPPTTPPADTVTFPTASTQGWLQQFGTGYVPTPPPSPRSSRNGDAAYGLVTDFQGNVIVLNKTYGAFPGFSNPNNAAEFVVTKFDSGGHQVWLQQFGTGMGDSPYAIAVDTQGNILVGGSTRGAFPGFTNSSGISQSVVIKLDPAGNILWTQQFSPSTGPSQVASLATDSQSNVVVGGNNKDAYNNGYGYISKLSGSNGTSLWAQGGNSTGNIVGVSGVAVDGQGNVIATGDFAVNPSTIYMVAKLNGANGQTVWQQQPIAFSPYGTQNAVYTQVALDPQGDIFIDGLNGSSGWAQCTVAELSNSTGTAMWQQSFGAAQLCIPGSIAIVPSGNVLMTGGTIYPFFPSSSPPNTDDVFVAKLSSSGSGVWLQQFGTGQEGAPGYTNANALTFVATDDQSHAYVAGTTASAFPGFTNPNGAFQVFVTQFGP